MSCRKNNLPENVIVPVDIVALFEIAPLFIRLVKLLDDIAPVVKEFVPLLKLPVDVIAPQLTAPVNVRVPELLIEVHVIAPEVKEFSPLLKFPCRSNCSS